MTSQLTGSRISNCLSSLSKEQRGVTCHMTTYIAESWTAQHPRFHPQALQQKVGGSYTSAELQSAYSTALLDSLSNVCTKCSKYIYLNIA